MLMPDNSRRVLEVFARFARLGLTSFGGPIAHLGYFRREFVEQAGWLDDATFSEIVAVCSALPGPTSSPVGMSIGALRAGPLGTLAAWLAFTAPSAILMALFGLTLRAGAAQAHGFWESPAWHGALDGLLGAAAAVVVAAVYGLARTLTRTMATQPIALVAFGAALLVDRSAPQLQWLPLVIGGLLGLLLIRGDFTAPRGTGKLPANGRLALAALAALLAIAIVLPALAPKGSYVALFADFFRAGSLVFGGGHVVLPFVQAFVGTQSVSAQNFYAGYAAAQVVPGPLFTFASFVGAADASLPSGVLGALVATLGIFAPSFLLLALAFPVWNAVRAAPRAAAALTGINASVVGLLAAVAIDPIGLHLLASPLALVTAVLALIALLALKFPAWIVVPAAGALACAAGALGAAR